MKATWELLKETFTEWQQDNAMRLAAALAYYTLFSLAPLVLLALTISQMTLGGQGNTATLLVNQVERVAGPDTASVIQTITENASQQSSNLTLTTIVSVGVLLFAATGVFGQLQSALNTVWSVEPKPDQGIMSLVRSRVLSFAMILVIGFLLLVSLLLSAALSTLSNYLADIVPAWGQIADFSLSFIVTTLLFAMIYRVLPDVEIEWGDVWIGAAVTALLFTIGKILLGLYMGYQSFSSTYGAAGSLLVFLVWIYYSTQILFFGAEFTQVYARKYGSRIVPSPHAVRYTKEVVRRQTSTPEEARQEEKEETREKSPVPTTQPAPSKQLARGLDSETQQVRKPLYNRYTLGFLGVLLIGAVIKALQSPTD